MEFEIEFLGKPQFIYGDSKKFFPVVGMTWEGEENGWRYFLDSTQGSLIPDENIKEVESDLEAFLKCPLEEDPLPRIIEHVRGVAKTFWCDYVTLQPYEKDLCISRIGNKDGEKYLVVKPRFFINKR